MAFDAAQKWNAVGEKHCARCYTTKPLSEFTVRKSGPRKGHPMSYCKPCRVHRQTQNYNNDTYQRIVRPYQLRVKYGVSVDEYNLMLEKQGFTCAICGTDDGASAKGSKTFAVDHCHTTGAVRGLLCNNCNRALGLLKDDLSVLESAIKYLKGSSQ